MDWYGKDGEGGSVKVRTSWIGTEGFGKDGSGRCHV